MVYAAVNVSPIHFWPLAFMGFLFPIIMLGHFFFGCFWLLCKHKYYSILSIVSFIAGLTLGGLPFQMHSTIEKKGIKIASFNVKTFNLYHWPIYRGTRDSIFEYLETLHPDIICFQEYYDDKTDDFKTTDTLKKLLKMKYSHESYSVIVLKNYRFGLATFSKYPIVHKGKPIFNIPHSTNNVIYTDIKIGEDTIRVFNCHLASIRLEKENFTTIEQIQNNSYNEKDYSGIRKIGTKLKKAFYRRAMQADTLSMEIRKSPYSVFVCGDFNDIPLSYTIHTIKKHNNLVDAFSESGHGMGGTYIGNLPSFRIDYILHSKDITGWNFTVDKPKLSDHYPIFFNFEIQKTTE